MLSVTSDIYSQGLRAPGLLITRNKMATKSTKLSSVNVMLSNIGQAPATTLDSTNPQVSLATLILDQVSTDVQTEGWVFNTEQDYPFYPDSITKEIAIPKNVLRLDNPQSYDVQTVIRQGKLYNKVTHSYKWDKLQNLDVTWLFDYEDLPEAAKQYITTRAANLFAMRATGSTEIAKYSEREEANARAALIEYECNQGDYSVFSDGTGVNPLRSYRPVSALWRY